MNERVKTKLSLLSKIEGRMTSKELLEAWSEEDPCFKPGEILTSIGGELSKEKAEELKKLWDTRHLSSTTTLRTIPTPSTRRCRNCNHLSYTHDRQTCQTVGDCGVLVERPANFNGSGTPAYSFNCPCRLGYCSCEHSPNHHDDLTGTCKAPGCACSMMTFKDDSLNPLVQEIDDYLKSFEVKA
jgi:hypothetical protein